MRGVVVGIVLALSCLPACRVRAATHVPPPPQDAPIQGQPVQAPPAQTLPPQAAEPAQPPAWSPVFVIYPANPPQRATILLNTMTGETWLLGVNGPGGQFQWTRIAVGDPSETAAPPR